mgnify:CR=1 FL=1
MLYCLIAGLLAPLTPRMYRRDTEGYYHQENKPVVLLSVYILPFLHKHLVLPFFSGFFAVFSEKLRSIALNRCFRKHRK